MGEGHTKAGLVFAAAYALCALLAFRASRTSSVPRAGLAPFWVRIGVVCGAFALLRAFDASIAVSASVREFSYSAGLTDWERPGPYIMIAALLAFGAAIAGLFVFRFRTLHGSVSLAASAIILLALLAVAHSVSLNFTGEVLQAMVGPITVSRIIEGLLLLALAYSTIWFVRDTRSGRLADQF